MRIGPLELQLKQMDDKSWRYRLTHVKEGEIKTEGYRPSENQARNAAFDDASLIVNFCR